MNQYLVIKYKGGSSMHCPEYDAGEISDGR